MIGMAHHCRYFSSDFIHELFLLSRSLFLFGIMLPKKVSNLRFIQVPPLASAIVSGLLVTTILATPGTFVVTVGIPVCL